MCLIWFGVPVGRRWIVGFDFDWNDMIPMNELIEEVLQTKKVTCRMNEIKRVVVRHIQGYHTLARLDAPNGRKGDQTGRGLFSPQSILLPTPL